MNDEAFALISGAMEQIEDAYDAATGPDKQGAFMDQRVARQLRHAAEFLDKTYGDDAEDAIYTVSFLLRLMARGDLGDTIHRLS